MKWLGNMTIGKRLLTMSIIIASIFIIEGFISLNSISRIGEEAQRTYHGSVVPLEKIGDMISNLQAHRIKLYEHIGQTDVNEMKKTREEMDNRHKEIDALLKEKDAYMLTPEEEKLFTSAVSNANLLFDSYREILKISEGFRKDDAFRMSLTENQKIFDQTYIIWRDIFERKTKDAKAAYDASEAIEKNAWLVMMLIIAAGISIVLIINFFITRSVSRSVNDAVNSISSTSTEIASTVEQHEKTATSQAASASETATTMDELNASSRQSTEQADAVAAMAKQALSTTEEGVKMAGTAAGGIAVLEKKVEDIGGQILRLSEQTGQIGGIANMVTDIAAQINMLALNAAVEAVRAGESGKGFAVIAQEVRKLADQGKKSAEKVHAIVADIQKATNSAVMVTEEGSKAAVEVAQIAQKAGESFTSLSEVANRVYENTQQVSLNSRQQASAIKQVTEAMNNISAGAKETAAGISQTRIGIQRLNETAQSLKKMV